jgi:putative oxidoreductase
MNYKLINIYNSITGRLSLLKDIPLLVMRLILAWGFWNPGMMKWKNISGIAEWYEGMGMPFPTLNAYLSATTEVMGSVLLLIGFAVRIISIPLMIIMVVAISMVHFTNGFEAGNNGFEIPLYYLIMLFTLFIYGGGNYGLDNLIRRISR